MAIEYSETTDSGYDVMNDVNNDLTIPGIEKVVNLKSTEMTEGNYSLEKPKAISTLTEKRFIETDDFKKEICNNPEYSNYRKQNSSNETVVDNEALKWILPQTPEEAYANLIDPSALENNMTSLNPNGPLRDFIKWWWMKALDAHIMQESITKLVTAKSDHYLAEFIRQFWYFICARADLLWKPWDPQLWIPNAYWKPLQTMNNMLTPRVPQIWTKSETAQVLSDLKNFINNPQDYKGVETDGNNKNGSNIFKKYCYDLLSHETQNS